MSRPLRIEYEGAFYHITSRGNEKGDIFIDDYDKDKFLHYIGVVHKRYSIIIYVYALMGNHYHMLMETPKANLSRAMRDLNGDYTTYFNRRHKRAGHLFQGRYGAILVEKEGYLLELSRYIHLNPVRAGWVKSPEDYKYTSMSYYLGRKRPPNWLDANWILEYFKSNSREATEAYREFVLDGIGGCKDPLENTYAQSILGTEKFVEWAKKKVLENGVISDEHTQSKRLRYGLEVGEIADAVIKFYNIDKDALVRKGKRANVPRNVFIYLVRKYADVSIMKVIQDWLPNIRRSAVSKIVSQVENEKEDWRLKEDIEKLERILL